MIDGESKKILESSLGKLLGFEEGEAEDLLEHLFTIDSDDDLSEYLIQLLGGQTPGMVDFVQNMSRYRRGESVAISGGDDGDSDEKEPVKEVQSSSTGQSTAAFDSFKALATGSNTKSRKNTKQQNKGSKSRVPPPKNINQRKKPPPSNKSVEDSSSSSSSINAQTRKQQPQQQSEQQHENAVKEKARPERGKPKVVCGCYGTKYKPLTNCLYCGRISCEAEGYDFCPFCGFFVAPPPIDGDGKAFLQKDRLLAFDRDFATRTKILDDQEDYQAPTTWMTEEEKEEVEAKQHEYLESLKRPKQMLKLDL